MGIVKFTQSSTIKAFYYYSTFLAGVNVFGYLASLSEATPTGVFRSATAQRAALSAEMRWIRRRRRRRGSEGSAAGGGTSALSEWQRSAESKSASTGAAFAGHRNRSAVNTIGHSPQPFCFAKIQPPHRGGRDNHLICVSVIFTRSVIFTVPTPKIVVCRVLFSGFVQYSGIIPLP